MTHGRKPRKPRVINANTFGTALSRSTCLLPHEVTETIAPSLECVNRMRLGVATEDHHTVLYSALLIAAGIERSRIVQGLQLHIDAALNALDAIRDRALASGVWRPTALYPSELTAITDAVRLHKYQLTKVSIGELHAIAARLIARTASSGGVVQNRSAQSLGLESGGVAGL